MAKNYIDNLSEEARKGMQEKAEQGIWPTKTPLGYRNIPSPRIGADREGAVRVVGPGFYTTFLPPNSLAITKYNSQFDPENCSNDL